MRRRSPKPDDDQIGVLWYAPGDWARLRRLSADVEDLEETHEEWLGEARRVVARLRKAGHRVLRVDADLDEILAWSRAHGLPLDGRARSEYAVSKMQEAAEAGTPLPEFTDEDLR